MRSAFHKFEKICKFVQNFKDAVVYGWGRPIFKKLEKTKEAASGDVNTNRFEPFMNSGIGGYFVNFALFQHGRTFPLLLFGGCFPHETTACAVLSTAFARTESTQQLSRSKRELR